MKPRCVATVGLGPVGLSWTVLFVAGGCRVRAHDKAPEARAHALPWVQSRLSQLEAVGAIGSTQEAIARLEVVDTLEAAVADASYVQESVAEDLAVKTALFRDLGRAAPADAILASSTSELRGSDFLDGMTHAERALVVHPVNPPHLIPLVEICPASSTSASCVESAAAFMTQLGRAAVVLRRELPGYLLNRLQIALVGEAMRLVRDGYCSAADADTVVREGLGRRWALMGPFEAAHLNAAGGARDYFTKFRPTIRRLMAAARPDVDYDDALLDQIHRELESRGREHTVAELQSQRDRRLLALARHLAGEVQP